MTHIPAALIAKWRRNATGRALSKLENLLEYRDVLDENNKKVPVETLEREAAAAMLVSVSHLRHAVGTIREYSEAQLRAWILKGVSFDHIARANSLSVNVPGAPDPAGILDLAIVVGGENGKTMTVEEMTLLIVGGQKMRPAMYLMNVILEKVANFAKKLDWPDEKRTAFEQAWIEFKKAWFS